MACISLGQRAKELHRHEQHYDLSASRFLPHGQKAGGTREDHHSLESYSNSSHKKHILFYNVS